MDKLVNEDRTVKILEETLSRLIREGGRSRM
jgi:hypothetical protein